MNKKNVIILVLSALSLFIISIFASGAGIKYKTMTDMIQDVYYNTSEHVYMAETATHWEIPLSHNKSEDTSVTVAYNRLYDGKLVKVEYDDNGGSSNTEDWTLHSWNLESR